MFKPLDGVRIIDLTQVLAGPYATYQLGLLGADVIKIENPNGGDWARVDATCPDLHGMGLAYLAQGANKKSVAINLKSDDGIALVKRMAASADIFVENFRPGTADRLGLSFDDIKAVNSRILYASISAYGSEGPLGGRAAYDHVVQGMCGIMSTTGTPETVPNKVGAPYIDYATGMNAAFAILSAYVQAMKDKKAHRIDVSMLDSAMLLMTSMVTQTKTRGVEQGAYGNEAFSQSPSSGAFETTSGTLMIAANNDRQFSNLCKGLGREDILDDERWAKMENRRENKAALRAEFEDAIRTNSADHWEQVLSDLGVPAARVRDFAEVLDEGHLDARDFTSAMQVTGVEEAVHVPNVGFRMDFDAVRPTSPPPRLGEDTAHVLAELGLTADEVNVLAQNNVIQIES